MYISYTFEWSFRGAYAVFGVWRFILWATAKTPEGRTNKVG
jgi:hypothetical protein